MIVGGGCQVTDTPAGACRPPVIFEPAAGLADAPELWVATSGPPHSWGGVHVFFGRTDEDDYQHVGTIARGIVHGVLLDPLPGLRASARREHVGITVQVAVHDRGQLLSCTPAQARGGRYLLYVGRGNQYEVLAYTGAELVDLSGDAHVYALNGYLWRDVYGTWTTPAGAVRPHAAGADVVLLGPRVLHLEYPRWLVDRVGYFKFANLNPFAEGMAPLADVPAIPVRITGRYLRDRRRFTGQVD